MLASDIALCAHTGYTIGEREGEREKLNLPIRLGSVSKSNGHRRRLFILFNFAISSSTFPNLSEPFAFQCGKEVVLVENFQA